MYLYESTYLYGKRCFLDLESTYVSRLSIRYFLILACAFLLMDSQYNKIPIPSKTMLDLQVSNHEKTLSTYQGRHGEFEPGKVQYYTPIFLTSCFLQERIETQNLSKDQSLTALLIGPTYL